jgi:hypothetical protein
MAPTAQVEAAELTLAPSPTPSTARREPSNPEAANSSGSPGKVHDREAGAGAGNGGNEDDENERCRRLVRTTVHVLDNVLGLRYGTADHPGGDPSGLFTFGCTGEAANYQYQIRVEPGHFIVTSGRRSASPLSTAPRWPSSSPASTTRSSWDTSTWT